MSTKEKIYTQDAMDTALEELQKNMELLQTELAKKQFFADELLVTLLRLNLQA